MSWTSCVGTCEYTNEWLLVKLCVFTSIVKDLDMPHQWVESMNIDVCLCQCIFHQDFLSNTVNKALIISNTNKLLICSDLREIDSTCLYLLVKRSCCHPVIALITVQLVCAGHCSLDWASDKEIPLVWHMEPAVDSTTNH